MPYPDVMNPKPRGEGLPGLTRSRHEASHSVITPESRVWCGLPGWDSHCSGAYLTSPQMNGALFSMCLVKMPDGAEMGPALEGVERFFLVLEGAVVFEGIRAENGKYLRITPDKSGDCEYMFIPAHALSMTSAEQFRAEGATTILLFEQVYRPSPYAKEKKPEFTFGFIDEKPTLDPGAPEVFTLRKLLPLEEAYDFNIHIMDFEPGQSLHCNEMHYNQHGMLILEGRASTGSVRARVSGTTCARETPCTWRPTARSGTPPSNQAGPGTSCTKIPTGIRCSPGRRVRGTNTT